jgi:spartin
LNTASSFYISRAQPHPSASPSRDGVAPPLPPRAIQWLTSADGRNSLNAAQSYTGKARQVTGRTAAAVEGVIARAMGNNKGKNRAVPPPPSPRRNDQSMFDPNMPATYTSSPTTPTEKGHAYGGYPASSAASATGVLPPYSSTTSLAAPAAGTRRVPPPPPTYSSSAPPSRTSTPSGAKETPGEKLTRKARLVLSAQLVLSTLDASGKKIVDVGSDRLAAVVGHKYGTEAANSTRIMTGAARNVVLVYIDVTGLGRRALIKTAGKHFIKAKIGGKEYKLKTDANGQVVEAQPVNEKA